MLAQKMMPPTRKSPVFQKLMTPDMMVSLLFPAMPVMFIIGSRFAGK